MPTPYEFAVSDELMWSGASPEGEVEKRSQIKFMNRNLLGENSARHVLRPRLCN